METNFNIIQQHGDSSVRLDHNNSPRMNDGGDSGINLVRQESSVSNHMQESPHMFKKPQLNSHNDSLGLDMLLSNMNTTNKDND